MCGIFGIYGHKDASRLTYLGLYALQHRGEESAGIVAANGGGKVKSHNGMGLVSDVFNEKTIKSLHGNVAVGHVRYSTTGSSISKNIQPFLVAHRKGHIAIAHNGNLVNTRQLRRGMESKGSIFQTSMDSELVVHLIAKSDKKDKEHVIIDALSQLEGAYSIILMLNNTLIGARDPYGFRPLCIGKLDGAYVLASETCALDLIQAKYVRDIEPGEIVFIDNKGLRSIKPFPPQTHASCIFEYIYFSRPDSNIFEKNVYLTRKRLGKQLAKEHPVKADLIMPIPDSGNYAALGFAEASNIPYEIGMIRNHYIGRTFIQPSQFIRDFKVKIKLNPIKDVLKGKRIVIIEDSIVRGTTSRIRVKTLREAGAKEIHMRVSCPPLISPCFYGIDFPTKKELIASNRTIESIKDFIGLDSLKYLSLEGMLKSMLLPKEEFCTACFTGNYPTKLSKKVSKKMLEKN
ncbi:MAG: amidophosphoribosyltransferase [Candidatus Omnitrophica bacterium]|nr:amidophosphoribosyltransferase [Candidatus Omnitrophota bacterium]MBU1047422.1 amidophosphoribosyltransferase [Candidatus Omnitrophota bacterium]MBU1630827.1 amidophosphoribosyltransferase [Candidatus Omnitrophota bacterium]MBU1888786.1 amidophosphoribosyltransferase [Candidatus Omnitrophota bacterium]